MNEDVAKLLREIARLLEEQGASYFRVNAYRRAANTVESLHESIREIIKNKGIDGLIELPGIGEGIARSIFEYAATGRMSRLETLNGKHDPVHLFESIPGVGPRLAARIHEDLHIDTLEALEAAAYSGGLEKVPGMGKSRVNIVRAWLASVLGKRSHTAPRASIVETPSVSMLLAVDRQYRTGVQQAKLQKIAPKRFNPEGKAWLPILHETIDGWHFTALYSNTQRAHALGRTRDWVVIYFYDQHHHEGQHTVVTETAGRLRGKRVVRGLESECRDYYSAEPGKVLKC